MKKVKLYIFGFTIAILVSVLFYSYEKHETPVVKVDKNILMQVFKKVGTANRKVKKPASQIQDVHKPAIENLKPYNALDIFRAQYNELKALYKKTKNPNVKDSFGATLTMYATMFNDYKMLKELLDAGAVVSGEDGKTMIFFALANKMFYPNLSDEQNAKFTQTNENIINLLIEQKMDFSANAFENYPMLEKFTPLTLAIRFDNISALKAMVNNGSIDITKKLAQEKPR